MYNFFLAAITLLTGFPNGVGPIWLDDVRCRGNESRLIDCPLDFLTGDCSHFEDIGIVCSAPDNCTQGDIRLQGGHSSHEGRIEICHDNVWGTVCDRLWGTEEARVACLQLGLPSSGE